MSLVKICVISVNVDDLNGFFKRLLFFLHLFDKGEMPTTICDCIDRHIYIFDTTIKMSSFGQYSQVANFNFMFDICCCWWEYIDLFLSCVSCVGFTTFNFQTNSDLLILLKKFTFFHCFNGFLSNLIGYFSI